MPQLGIASQPPNQWWRWRGYERKEVRDDKVNFFVTYLRPGKHTFDYAVRAVTPGVFSARPAEVYAMYRPDVWGRSASDQVVVDRRQIEARPVLSGDVEPAVGVDVSSAAVGPLRGHE